MENIEHIYGLSPMQEGMLFHTLLTPETRPYFEQGVFTISGKIHYEHFKSAWRRAVDHQPSLRTAFFWKDLERPVQIVHRRLEFPIVWEDWSTHSEAEREDLFRKFLREDRERGFELSRPPLLRLSIFQWAEKKYKAVLSFHHLLLDAWSLQLLLRGVMAYYQSLCAGVEIELEPSRPYRDYIGWLQRQDLSLAESFWRQELAGFVEPTRIGALYPARSIAPDQEFSTAKFPLPADLSAALRSFAARNGVTLNTTVQGAWAVLLARHTGSTDLVFGSTVSGRPAELSGVENIIGLFINTLPLRIPVPRNESISSWLKAIQNQQQQAVKYQHSPLSQVQKWSEIPAGKPLFDHLLVFEGIPNVGVNSSSQEELVEFDFELISRTGYPLTLMIEPHDEILVKAIYSTLHFDHQALPALIRHLQSILHEMTQDETRLVWQIAFPSHAGELAQPMAQWNSTHADFPEELTLPQLFQEQAAETPTRIAVEDEEGFLTYADLNIRANQLAHYLRHLGVGAETRVGICLHRRLDMMVALLGVLKTGAAYVPIDPKYPAERTSYVLKDSEAAVLVTERALADHLPDTPATIVKMDEQWQEIAKAGVDNLSQIACSDNIAYVIYTSGSTGKPKGVQISHRALTNFLFSMKTLPGIGADDVLLAVTTLSFDIAGLELYLPLIAGGRVKILNAEAAMDGKRLRQEIAAGVTIMQATPTTWLLLLEAGWQGKQDLKILCGGEALVPELARRLVGKSHSLWNMYGPTETTIWSALERVEQVGSRVSIGKPIANTDVYILDEKLEAVPFGTAGELCIGGDGLARGYWKKPELTAEKFIPHPSSKQRGARLYRTGDLARFTPEGKLECLGRIDLQVKVRGFRIELGEIEAALSECEGVEQAAVVARDIQAGEKQLVAYVVSRSGMEHDQEFLPRLRTYLREKLPEYMVPAQFMFLEALPLTPNGKIDRRALPAPPAKAKTEKDDEQRTPVQELTAGIWQDVLQVPHVGLTENFFELGAHSLLATRVISRIRAVFGVELPLRVLFETPTVTQLAARIEQEIASGGRAKSIPIQRADRSQDLPLSYSQQRLWFLDQLEPGTTAYNMPFGVRLRGKLNREAVQYALNEIVRRHEVLRTCFPERDGIPRQEIMPPVAVPIAGIDLRSVPEAQREREARKVVQEKAGASFDLRRDPLMVVKLLQLSESDHVLLPIMHHIVADGWSLEIMMREFVALYEAHCAGQPSPLPELEIQYADFAAWQREWLRGELLEEQLEYWSNELEGVVPLDLPADRSRPPMPTGDGDDLNFNLGAELTEALKKFSQKQGVTNFMTLLAVFQLLLSRYSGQKDFAVGTDVANRTHLELEPLVGFFVNQLVLRARINPEASFRQILEQVRKTTVAAHSHQEIPFEKVVERLQPQRDLSRSPLFQVKLVMQNAVRQAPIVGDLRTARFEAGGERVRMDLELVVAETPEGLIGVLHYSRDLFDEWRVQQMLEHFKQLLRQAIENVNVPVWQLSLLTQPERQQILTEWNRTAREHPHRFVHEWFSLQARQIPDAVAARSQDGALTYADLERRSNQLSHYLQGLGVSPETLVGICLERGLTTPVALLGVLKAGVSYVPLDPDYPTERLGYMLENSQIPILLTQSSLRGKLPAVWVQTVCLDDDWQEIAGCPEVQPSVELNEDNLAYVIYTSGSTGQPKGVGVTHRGLANYLNWAVEAYKLADGSGSPLHSSLGFDLSITSIYPALLTGGSVSFISQSGGIEELAKQLSSNDFSLVKLTPSHLQMLSQLLQEKPQAMAGTRSLVIGGEALKYADLDLWRKHAPQTRFINEYGPTETVVGSTIFEVAEASRGDVPIGKPLANTEIYVLDEYGEPAPVGNPGEIYIGGAGVARGYINRPELTAERFVPDHVSGKPGGRLYRTGDKARWCSNGVLEYLGRSDSQVKVRGYRIELGEIEFALKNYQGVREVAVVVDEFQNDKRLVAYIGIGQAAAAAARANGAPAPQTSTVALETDVRQYLAGRLPEYMLPSAFVVLESLPLTANGKLDRTGLPKPEEIVARRAAQYVPPQTPTEEVLVSIWAELLPAKKIGIQDNFFDLGGHSLLAAQVVARIRKSFGVDLPLRRLFESPTIAKLASVVEEICLEEIEKLPEEEAARLIE